MTSNPTTIPTPPQEKLNHALEIARAALADHDRAVQALVDYYDPRGKYAGATFLDLPNDQGDLTATDLYALWTLDVQATPLAGRRLLHPGTHRTAVLEALAAPELPFDADLTTAGEATWEAAEQLYLALRAALGRNPWVTASKLAARKRPRFFPIRDSVVTERLLGLGRSYFTDWAVYRHLLHDDNLAPALNDALDKARQERGAVIPDPPLRVLDVVLWATAPAKCASDATDTTPGRRGVSLCQSSGTSWRRVKSDGSPRRGSPRNAETRMPPCQCRHAWSNRSRTTSRPGRHRPATGQSTRTASTSVYNIRRAVTVPSRRTRVVA